MGKNYGGVQCYVFLYKGGFDVMVWKQKKKKKKKQKISGKRNKLKKCEYYAI